MKLQRIAIVAVVTAAALVTGAWLIRRDAGAAPSVYQQARLFDDVLARVADDYVDSIPESKLYDMAIDGMLGELHDPYSVYLKPDDFRQLNEATTGDYGGLGFQFEVQNGVVTVVAPLPDTPAERAGLETGDEIIALDGQSTIGWKDDDVRNKMRGQPGTPAVLSVRRAGVDKPLTFKIVRERIHVRSVGAAMMLDKRVGYVALSPVSQSSAEELADAVDSLTGAGMKVLVLDLRGNPGGLLDQGVAVSDLFLDPGQEIVSTRGRAPGSNRVFRDRFPQRWSSLPVEVLVNQGTASAAEIISGALQDHDRALVIGTPTFGKGLVQSLFQLTDETALKLTTARWYTPSGRTIQRKSTSEEAQFAEVDAAAVGHDTTKIDSSLVFHTDHGRTVYGGGGIRPDLFVAPDTFTTAERAFMKALGAKIPVYNDVISGYAIALRDGHALKNPDFAVTPAMVDEVLKRLQARGAGVPASVAEGARTLIAQTLAYEAERYSFGRVAELRRRFDDDRQLQRALDIARGANSLADLFTRAGTDTGASARN